VGVPGGWGGAWTPNSAASAAPRWPNVHLFGIAWLHGIRTAQVTSDPFLIFFYDFVSLLAVQFYSTWDGREEQVLIKCELCFWYFAGSSISKSTVYEEVSSRSTHEPMGDRKTNVSSVQKKPLPNAPIFFYHALLYRCTRVEIL
jgi:hypothetical protein